MIRRGLFGIMGLAMALTVFAAPAQAQVELGWDMVLAITSISDCEGCDNVTTVTLPEGQFRAGFFLSPTVEIEPSVGFQLVSSGGSTFTAISLGADLLYHFSEDATKSQVFLAVGPGLSLISGGGTISQFSLRAALGVKVPASDQMSFRIAGGYERGFENDDVRGTNSFGVLFGVSVMVGE